MKKRDFCGKRHLFKNENQNKRAGVRQLGRAMGCYTRIAAAAPAGPCVLRSPGRPSSAPSRSERDDNPSPCLHELCRVSGCSWLSLAARFYPAIPELRRWEARRRTRAASWEWQRGSGWAAGEARPWDLLTPLVQGIPFHRFSRLQSSRTVQLLLPGDTTAPVSRREQGACTQVRFFRGSGRGKRRRDLRA